MKGTSALTWGVLLGLIASAAVYFGVIRKAPVASAPAQQPGYAVTEAACREVAAAVAAYEKQRQRRPERLMKLVELGLLREGALLDERRPPSATPTTGPARRPLDVTYVAGVRPSDPKDLVLVCTLVLREGEDRYHVITNDGTYHAMTRPELITALNRTYSVIGKDIPFHMVHE